MFRLKNGKKERVGLAGILLFAAACGSKEFPDGTNYPGSYHLMNPEQITPTTVQLRSPRCEIGSYTRTVRPYDGNPDLAQPEYGQIVELVAQGKSAAPQAVWGDDCKRDGKYESGGIVYKDGDSCRWGPNVSEDGPLWFKNNVCRADQIANAATWLNTAEREPTAVCKAAEYNPAPAKNN